MPEGNKILSRNIRKARINAGLTQQKATELLDITPLHYGRLERADRRTSLEQIEEIARVFQISPYALIDGCFKDSVLHAPQADSVDIQYRLNALLAHSTPEEQMLCYDICERIIRGK